MILKQKFKTLSGAQKRRAFEATHPMPYATRAYKWAIVRFTAEGMQATSDMPIRPDDYYRLIKTVVK